MHVQIKSIIICNYRSCVRTRFTPNPSLSALIGRNGSGKSSILNAIQFLRAIPDDTRWSRRQVQAGGRSRFDVTFLLDGKEVDMRATILHSTSERSRENVVALETRWNLRGVSGVNKWYEFPLGLFTDSALQWSIEQGSVVRRVRLSKKWRTARANYGHWTTHSSFGLDLAEVTEHASKLREIAEFLRGISYYSAAQFTDPSKCPASLELEDDRPEPRLVRATDHSRFILDLYLAYRSRAESSKFDEFFSLVGPDGLGLIEKWDFKELALPQSRYEVSSGGKVIKQQLKRKLVVPSVKEGGTRLSPSQLSEGTFKTIALLFYLVSDKGNLLLIEEPEVCIHHGLLKSIIELIKEYSKTKQIIVSTHSDFVLDALTAEDVFLVSKQNKFGTKVSPISKAMSRSDFHALRIYLAESGNLGEFWRHGGLETRA